jgi:hypothetical protein
MTTMATKIRELLAEHRRKQLPAWELARALAEHDAWLTPDELSESKGERTALMFCDETAYRLGQDVLGKDVVPDGMSRVPGATIFETFADKVDAIAINAGSEHAVTFAKEALPFLRDVGAGVLVERALAQLLEGDDPKAFRRVKAYAKYVVPVDGSSSPIPAPDDRKRVLFAAFTTERAYDAFVKRHRRDHATAMSIANGEELFARIKAAPCAGVVFNCSGPSTVAFARDFAGDVLKHG